MSSFYVSTYNNGPGNVPRLPDRVVDTLISTAGVSGLTYNNQDQTKQIENLVHDTCEELLARLPSTPDLLAKIKALALTIPQQWEMSVTDASAIGESRAMAREVNAWRALFAQLKPIFDGVIDGGKHDERSVQAPVRSDEATKPAIASSCEDARADAGTPGQVAANSDAADSELISDLASAFQEYLYRVSSQVPFDIAQWAQQRGAALLAQLKTTGNSLQVPARPIILHRPLGTPGWYEGDANYTQQLMNSPTAARFEFRTVYQSPVLVRAPEPFDWFHTTRNSDGSTITTSTRENDPEAFPLYTLAGTSAGAQERADAFCDAHCVWTNHHPDCPYGTRAPHRADGVLTTEQLLRIIGESTGRRINLGLDDLDQYLSVARASISAAFAMRGQP